MSLLNTNAHLSTARALLSATLAGGILAYSTLANAATDKNQAETQAAAQTNQVANTDQRQSGPDNAAVSDSNQQQQPDMDQIDQNTDAELVWTEIYAIYDEELDDAAWTETYVFETYDQNADSSLNEDEYALFVSGLADASAKQNSAATSDSGNTNQAGGQNQQAATTDNDRQQEPQQAGATEQSAEAAAVVSVITIAETALTPSELEAREVVNYNNDEIGDVEQVITSPDGAISGLVVGVGGFWGMGEKDVFVPANELRAYGDKVIWETFLNEDQLEELPHYQAESYSVAD